MSSFQVSPSNESFYDAMPGYYLGIPDMDYHAKKELMSNSLLKNAVRSNARLHVAITEEVSPQSPEQRFGVGYHYALLEPEMFDERVVEAPDCIAVKGNGERCMNVAKYLSGPDPYCGTHIKSQKGEIVGIGDDPETIVITPDEYEHLRRMQEKIFAHPQASLLLEGANNEFHEGVAVWEHTHETRDGELVSFRSRAKIDHFNREFNALVDPKTTKDASMSAFSKAIFEYHYYTQGPMYIEGMNALGLPVEDFILIAQEKTPPYDINIVMLDTETMEIGRKVLDVLYERYAAYLLGDRSSYSNKIRPIGIPFWAKKQLEEQLFS